MDTKVNPTVLGDKIVYIKSVAVADLPEDIQEQAGSAAQLFAVHNSAGQQLALVGNRTLAFALARQNHMRPVTVH